MKEPLVEATELDITDEQAKLATEFIEKAAKMSGDGDSDCLINSFLVATSLFLDVIYTLSDLRADESPEEANILEFHADAKTYGIVFYRKDHEAVSVQ